MAYGPLFRSRRDSNGSDFAVHRIHTQKAVGASFLAILDTSISALVSPHSIFANVDYKASILLGVEGIIGAQIRARLVQQLATEGERILHVY